MTGFNLSEWALRHRSFVWYLIISLTVAGGMAYMRLGREEDPAFTIKTMVVQANWPGATIEDTMKLVTDPIEKKLEEIPYLDYVKSYTKPGISVVYVNLKDYTPAEAVPDLWYQVRKKIADMKSTLPQGVQGPAFNDEFGDTFGTVFAFTADGFSYRELKDYAETARADLMRVPDVGKIQFVGVQNERIYLDFSTRKLAAMGIDREQVIAELQAQNAVAPAGVVQAGDEKISVRVSGAFTSEDSLRAISLRANDKFYRLADLADIRRGYADPPSPLFRYNGEPAIGMIISMAAGGNVLTFGEGIRERMRQVEANLPVGIGVHLVANQSVVVEESVAGFTKALKEAVVIVLVVSFISLGLRAGLVVATSIPLVLGMTFIGMEFFDITLQRISLGALIIALGLLVDDAMITVEMMITKLEEGFSLDKAATFAYTSTAFPMLTGTLITVAGFIPIGFAQGGAAEYCFTLFAVVAMALLFSWIVAVLFAPLIGVNVLPKTMKAKHGSEPGRLMRMFRGSLRLAMRARYVVIVATLLLFGLSVFGLRFVQQQFFPASDRPELLVNLTLPQTASIRATEEVVDRFEKVLAADPDVERWSFYIGQGAVRFYLPLDVQLANDYFAQAVVVTKGYKVREAVRARLEKVLNENFSDLNTRVSPLEMGPPVGWPIQYRVSGPDVGEVRAIAARMADTIGTNPYTLLVNYDWNEPSKVVRVDVDQDKARLLGISSKSLNQALNATVSGAAFTQVRDDIYLIDVVAQATNAERSSIETLRNLQIAIPDGRTVPLGEVATMRYDLEQPVVWRRTRLPTITVQADLVPPLQAATVVQQLAPAVDELRRSLPPGYSIEAGGTVENSAKGMASITAVFPIMVFIMLTILMIQLQSFQKLFLVISVAPLGLIGVVAALLPTGTPLGFVAILGVVALIGMIVRNSVIMIAQIDEHLEAGEHPWDAVINATMHRVRPILLTAAAASLGMIPIAPEVFWGPMAYAIIGGLIVATLLTLFFLPALYVAWFRIREPAAEERAKPRYDEAVHPPGPAPTKGVTSGV
ncbi:efflux RND transporter permease subunit [Azospirillum brasilense]|uniref:Efflux RND transporter permease subunit n=1 Tax=Azospirillum brasilense TaxID=192 RepID=A0A0P0F184_AZOBR|nr:MULTISPECIES: efflux RND transporter permease subunit [Azospirillum]ALJ38548.1 ACR family transporter [Azospirillum brasilense]MDW7553211.1 efflux RND transporter permease subunit [Azospirillum brasilense]MDW7593410.1 efflux RND transporter permease subunit [Azospirillum brasilense]MDW7628530.1 efflux RND transporter permease subunit [Azospirillum brasilense]MDX5955375.1 efflux RND transporter permease subunit [Azospirillum brasilense]